MAICRVVSPWAMSIATSRSRGVSLPARGWWAAAHAATAAREWRPSLCRRRSTCLSTVRAEMPSAAPICRLVSLRLIREATCRWRSVSTATALLSAGANVCAKSFTGGICRVAAAGWTVVERSLHSGRNATPRCGGRLLSGGHSHPCRRAVWRFRRSSPPGGRARLAVGHPRLFLVSSSALFRY